MSFPAGLALAQFDNLARDIIERLRVHLYDHPHCDVCHQCAPVPTPVLVYDTVQAVCDECYAWYGRGGI